MIQSWHLVSKITSRKRWTRSPRSTSNSWENFEGRQWNSMLAEDQIDNHGTRTTWPHIWNTCVQFVPEQENLLKKKAIWDNTKQCRIRSKAKSWISHRWQDETRKHLILCVGSNSILLKIQYFVYYYLKNKNEESCLTR